MMKRFLLFEFNDYYPIGGWNDFVGSFDSIEEAKASTPKGAENVQIVDAQSGVEVASGYFDEEEAGIKWADGRT